MSTNKKRRYNACYRLRKKLAVKLPPRSHIIYTLPELDIDQVSEIKILLKEYSFIIQPLLFSEL